MSQETKQMTAEEVRAAFPSMIQFADEMRAVFGDGVRLVYVKENGRELGASPESPDDRVFTVKQNPPELLPEPPKYAKRRKHG